MPNEAVAVTAIIMSGAFLSVVAWQLLAIARSAVARDRHERIRELSSRLQALEELHHADPPDGHDRPGTP